MAKKKSTVTTPPDTDIFGQLKENPKNPRTISKDKFQKLKKSILDFPKMMELRPIIYDKDKVVLGGNMRLKALRELVIEGLKVKPEYFKAASDLTKKEIKQFIVADNLPFGSWSFDLLAEDYSIEELIDFGFDEKELDLDLWQSEKTDEQLDDAPEPQKTAISKTGDIFLLGGKHRILCSDCVNGGHLDGFMGGTKANLVVSDPPYNVNYGAIVGHPSWKRTQRGKTRVSKTRAEGSVDPKPGHPYWADRASKGIGHAGDLIQNDNLSPEKWNEFVTGYMSQLMKYCTGAFYIFMSNYEMYSNKQIFETLGGHWASFIIWKKDTLVLGMQDYQRIYEPMLYGWKEKGKHYWCGDRNQTDVWEVKRPKRSDEHPTMKPIELCKRAILNSSKNGDVVLDLFLGSGSTLIAAEEAGRTCFGTEISPQYIDVIIKRYHKLYPDKPIECLTNKNFNFKKLYEEQNGEAKI